MQLVGFVDDISEKWFNVISR